MDLKDLYIGREVYYVDKYYNYTYNQDDFKNRKLKKSTIRSLVTEIDHSGNEEYKVHMLNGDKVVISPQKEEDPTSVSMFLSEEEEKQNKLECYKHLLKRYEGYLKENKERIEELKQLLSERSED